jgi:hypothetical protein
MKTNVPIQKQRIETKTQPPDIQRRINAGWLKLWRAVYPNTPPPAAAHPKANPTFATGGEKLLISAPLAA